MVRSAGLLALLLTSTALAQTVDGTIQTLIAAHQDPRDGALYTVVPMYQLLTLDVGGIHAKYLDELRISVSGWGELALGDPREGVLTGDVDVGFVEARLFGGRLQTRLGRQFVFAGITRALQLDGASVTWRIWRDVGLTGWGGAPVAPRFGTKLGDVAVGARMFFAPRWNTEVGLSFMQVNDAGRIAEQDLGADARWQVIRALALSAYATLNLVELRLAEGSVAATFKPTSIAELRVDYRRTAPDLFLPRSSILSVFSQESHDETGASVWLRPTSRVRFDADYHAIVDLTGTGQRGGLQGNVYLGRAFETSLGTELRVLHLSDKGYVRARLFAVERPLPKLVFTLDLDAYRLEQPLNGQLYSFTGAATVGWDFHLGWRAVLSGVGDVTPFVQQRFEVMGKLVYNWVYRVHEVQR
jgi:hypothetical protein